MYTRSVSLTTLCFGFKNHILKARWGTFTETSLRCTIHHERRRKEVNRAMGRNIAGISTFTFVLQIQQIPHSLGRFTGEHSLRSQNFVYRIKPASTKYICYGRKVTIQYEDKKSSQAGGGQCYRAN
jgi:hypothetical protein